jgi:hypothetical protein
MGFCDDEKFRVDDYDIDNKNKKRQQKLYAAQPFLGMLTVSQ